MLDDAVAAYLDAIVSERAFDESLLAIIRSQGFTDVHLVHGQREFGKDVIGRRDGEQWAWQSKIGNIGQSQWRELVGQIDELRLVNLGHGAFDTTLPRKPVLVTTGRLTGNAPELYRDYNDRAGVRGEPKLELWTRDHLLGLLSGNPDAVLRGSMDGQLLAVLGSVDAQTATVAGLELFSRRWTAWEPERVTLERRSGSGLATVLLDLCATLGLDELYADVYNDIHAVKIHPQVLRLAEGPDEYIRTGLSNRLDPHVDFAEELPSADPVAPHHRDAAGRTLAEGGRTWDLLAISSALRDRHFVRALTTRATV